VENVAVGREEFEKDREEALIALTAFIQARFSDFIHNPIMQAARSFEHRR